MNSDLEDFPETDDDGDYCDDCGKHWTECHCDDEIEELGEAEP
jgi:hypothetical protein